MTLIADCWWHGEEPIAPGVFRVCPECGHAWTAEALVAAHNAPDELGSKGVTHETDPDKVYACPLCIHDF